MRGFEIVGFRIEEYPIEGFGNRFRIEGFQIGFALQTSRPIGCLPSAT